MNCAVAILAWLLVAAGHLRQRFGSKLQERDSRGKDGGDKHGQDVAQELSGRHAGQDRRGPVQVHSGPARQALHQVRRQAGLSQPRPTISYAELEELSRAFAAYLQGLPGLARGERVAIMSPNLLQYPVVLFGILRAGMVVVNVNPLYTPRELEHQLQDSGARAIVIVENFASTLQQVLGKTRVKHVITTQVGDLLPIPNAGWSISSSSTSRRWSRPGRSTVPPRWTQRCSAAVRCPSVRLT